MDGAAAFQGKRLELTAVGDDDLLSWSVISSDGSILNLSDNLHSFDNLAENDMLVIEPLSLDGGDKELRSVGVGSGVGH